MLAPKSRPRHIIDGAQTKRVGGVGRDWARSAHAGDSLVGEERARDIVNLDVSHRVKLVQSASEEERTTGRQSPLSTRTREPSRAFAIHF